MFLTNSALPLGAAGVIGALAALLAVYGARLDLALWDTVEHDVELSAPPTVDDDPDSVLDD